MKKYIVLLKNIICVIKKEIRDKRKIWYVQEKNKNGYSFDIVESKQIAEVAYNICPEVIETIPRVKNIGIDEGGSIVKRTPRLDMYLFENVLINTRADWIIKENKVAWNKYFMPQFSITIPTDYGYIDNEKGKLWLGKNVKKNEMIEVDTGFSIGGTQSTYWGHFLLQYLPMLYEIPKVICKLNGKKLTVILPEYSDKHILTIVDSYLKQFDNIEILRVGLNTNIHCQKLFHMEQACFVMEHSEYILDATWNMTTYAVNSLKNNLLKEINSNSTEEARVKIYFDRPMGMARRLTNGEEIKSFFVKKGFIIPENLSAMSLKEKITLIQKASFIAGPEGAAFSNIVFCRPNTKILKFESFMYNSTTYASFYAYHWQLEYKILSSFCISNNSPHGDYYLPMEYVKQAYESFDITE